MGVFHVSKDNDSLEIWGENEKPQTVEILEAIRKAKNIQDFTRQYIDAFMDVTFKDYLNNLLVSRGLKKSAIIKASGVSDSYAFQIFQGYKNPSRDKLLALAVAMKLSYDECQRLLKLAGVNELYAKNRRDAIVIFGLERSLSVPQLNDLLFELEEFTLG